jgi:hypothetical protein
VASQYCFDHVTFDGTWIMHTISAPGAGAS